MKLYFRNTTSGLSGLPTSEQSSLTVDNNGDAQTVNRLLSTTIGSAQTSKNCNTDASSSAQVAYFTRFVSPVLSSTSISANTWNFAFASSENNVNANFPCSGDGKTIWVNVYVWNTGSQTKFGTVKDGATNADYDEPNTASQETSLFGTFAGSAVNSIPANCVLVYEAIFQFMQNNATARTVTLYYDGTTEDNQNGDTVSNHASYIETPQTLTFSGGNITKSLTSTVTSNGGSLARKTSKFRGPTTQTVTIGASTLALLRNKKRALTETTSISTDAGSPSFIKAKNVAKAVPAETVAISSTVGFTRMRNRALTSTVNILSTVDYLQHPKKFTAKITETVLLHQTVAKISGKKRTLLN